MTTEQPEQTAQPAASGSALDQHRHAAVEWLNIGDADTHRLDHRYARYAHTVAQTHALLAVAAAMADLAAAARQLLAGITATASAAGPSVDEHERGDEEQQ